MGGWTFSATAERTVECTVAGRTVRITGRHDAYLDGLSGTDFGGGPLFRLATEIPPGGVYLDVGANIGATAIPVALTRPDIRVFAFEPGPDNADFLEKNIAANKIRNCAVCRTAVGATERIVTINDNGPWSTIGFPGLSVPVTTLDRWCAAHLPGTRVSLIKIDVEGYEPEVLAGAEETLRRDLPTLMMEFNSWTLLLHDHDPIGFARYLIGAFTITGDRELDTADAIAFVHANLTRYGCVNDLALLPKPAFTPPDVESLAFRSARERELAGMVRALRASRSWRLTAPMRAIGSAIRQLHGSVRRGPKG